MPNTPCLIGEGMTVIARGAGVTDDQAKVAMEIFGCVGGCLEAEDKTMDAVTSLNGSGPAFAYIVLEALCDGGVRMGLRRDTAMQIAAQMLQGAARMVLQTGMHPAALKDQVTTPAGSTIAGLLILEDGRIRSVIARAVEEAARSPASSDRVNFPPCSTSTPCSRPKAWSSLVSLTVMEIVLGIDNVLLVAILPQKVKPAHRTRVRQLGIGLALVLRIALLFALTWLTGLTRPCSRCWQRDVGAGSGAAGGRPLPHRQGDAPSSTSRIESRDEDEQERAPTAKRAGSVATLSRSPRSTSCSRWIR